MNLSADIVIIGSGIGGATAAFALAGTGARILVLERGERLVDTPETRDARAIFQQGVFRTRESWLDGRGQPFSPGNFYNVGGNSKFFGAIMYRYRAEDFSARRHMEGSTPDWPFGYDDLEPWYGAAEKLFRVRGELGDDPTEPPHSTGYDFPAVPDEPSLAIARERLRRQGIHASSLPIAVDHVALQRPHEALETVRQTLSESAKRCHREMTMAVDQAGNDEPSLGIDLLLGHEPVGDRGWSGSDDAVARNHHSAANMD